MRRPLTSLILILSLNALACADSAGPDTLDAAESDAGRTGSDAAAADAVSGTDAAQTADGGVPEDGGTPTDGGVATDGGTPSDAGTPTDAAGPIVCDSPYSIDGVVSGGIGATPRILLPGTTSPSTITRIDEASTFIAGDLAWVTAADELMWHAQISHLTMFDQIRYEHLLIDPADGAMYVAVEQQMHSDTTSMRFYGADGNLAFELTRGGPAGQDIEGANRQSNFFLLKYASDGALQWVSRFGPNSPSTTRAGQIPVIGLVPDGVRVTGTVEGSTQIVVGAGKPNELLYQAPNAHSFWATLSKTDGSYVPNSIRRIDVDRSASGTTLNGLAFSAHNAQGETAIGGRLVRDAAAPTFTIGAGGAGQVAVTTTQTRALFAKLAADGSPAFVATVAGPNAVAAPEVRAVGLGPNGELVGGGQFTVLAGDAQFYAATSTQSVTYAAQTSFLVAYAPTGEIRWVKLLPNTNRNAVSRILVTADAVYLLGTAAAGVVMGSGEANETTLSVNGYVLSKHALDTGNLQWLRVFTDEAGRSAIGGYDVWTWGSNLVVPVSFNTFRLVGPGVDRVYQSLHAGTGLLGALVLNPAGDVLECQPIAEGGGTFRPL